MEHSKVQFSNEKQKDKEVIEDKSVSNEQVEEENDGSTFEEEPQKKIQKLDLFKNDFSLNPYYMDQRFVNMMQKQWKRNTNCEDFIDSTSGVEIYVNPYQICILPDLLKNKISCNMLMEEIIQKVKWERKEMDLYEFYQSTDLSNMLNCHLLTNFLQTLRRHVRPWLEKITDLKLDYVSASCSMYTCGDFLLVHDDLLKDRQVAFVYYLSPWEGAEKWNAEQGGCLEIFNCDEQCFPHFPVQRKISPKNNQLAFFKVGARSFHQVGEVTTFDYPRLTINGWFHGASNEDLIADIIRPFPKMDFKSPLQKNIKLEELINEIYLRPLTRKSIQKRIEDNSEICLYEFLRGEVFKQALKELSTDDMLKWCRQGPANAQNYEILDLSSARNTVSYLISLFSSAKIFALLHDYTDLDLFGSKATRPTCSLEVQRWARGNYTVLGDGVICEENTLDLIFYLNAIDGAGVITYLSPEDESISQKPDGINQVGYNLNEDDDESAVLLTITPVNNALNIVYRCEGTTKFTKYVSHNTPLDKGPVFIFSCCYKE